MKRYDIVNASSNPWNDPSAMEEEEFGEYVRFEDVLEFAMACVSEGWTAGVKAGRDDRPGHSHSLDMERVVREVLKRDAGIVLPVPCACRQTIEDCDTCGGSGLVMPE